MEREQGTCECIVLIVSVKKSVCVHIYGLRQHSFWCLPFAGVLRSVPALCDCSNQKGRVRCERILSWPDKRRAGKRADQRAEHSVIIFQHGRCLRAEQVVGWVFPRGLIGAWTQTTVLAPPRWGFHNGNGLICSALCHAKEFLE